jgi:hypothetical protein
MHRRASSFLFDKSRKGDGYLLEDAYHCAPSKGEIPKLVPRSTNRMNVTPWREQQKKFLLRCSKRKCVRCTNLISFPDVITLLFHEIDASYHGCSNRDKRYLNHAITKGTAWWVSDGQVYKLLATYTRMFWVHLKAVSKLIKQYTWHFFKKIPTRWDRLRTCITNSTVSSALPLPSYTRARWTSLSAKFFPQQITGWQTNPTFWQQQ